MLNYSESYVAKEIYNAGGIPEIEISLQLLNTYLNEKHYPSKMKRLSEWSPDKGELNEIILCVFTICLTNNDLKYQTIIGMVENRIGCMDRLDRAKTAAEVIAVISHSGLINIIKYGRGKSIMVSTSYQVDSNIPISSKHDPIVEAPDIIHTNNGNLILGVRENRHKGNICLDHINRMNAIPLSLNLPLLRKYEEAPTFDLDTKEKEDQWNKFIIDSYRTYIKLAKNGNKFYLEHKVDTRGRSYAMGYHITTQGSSFKKAIVEFANKEIVENQ